MHRPNVFNSVGIKVTCRTMLVGNILENPKQPSAVCLRSLSLFTLGHSWRASAKGIHRRGDHIHLLSGMNFYNMSFILVLHANIISLHNYMYMTQL